MKDQSHSIWIVVADGGHARILLNRRRDEGVTQLPLVGKHNPRLASHDAELASGVHHTPAYKPTEEMQRESKFIDTLAETLQTAVARKECDGIILVMPAKVLGHFRNALNANTLKLIIGEVVHDYTHQDNRFVYEQVKQHLPL